MNYLSYIRNRIRYNARKYAGALKIDCPYCKSLQGNQCSHPKTEKWLTGYLSNSLAFHYDRVDQFERKVEEDHAFHFEGEETVQPYRLKEKPQDEIPNDHVHKLSVRASNQYRPVVEYAIYCRECNETIDKTFTLEMVSPDVRRSQLIFTAAKYVGMEKAQKWGRSKKFDEFYRNDFAETLKSVIPQPGMGKHAEDVETAKDIQSRLYGKFPTEKPTKDGKS